MPDSSSKRLSSLTAHPSLRAALCAYYKVASRTSSRSPGPPTRPGHELTLGHLTGSHRPRQEKSIEPILSAHNHALSGFFFVIIIYITLSALVRMSNPVGKAF